MQDRPNVRPWSLHRTGYAGSQRYGGWIWSGDIDGKWETLAAHVLRIDQPCHAKSGKDFSIAFRFLLLASR